MLVGLHTCPPTSACPHLPTTRSVRGGKLALLRVACRSSPIFSSRRRNSTGSSVASTCAASDPTAQRLCHCYFNGQCPSGWAPYFDNGVEGHDSCLVYNSATVTFATALASCPSGSHLLTMGASSGSISHLFNTMLGLSGYYTNGLATWLGCSQVWGQPYKNVGWTWVDGTNNSNLYTGVNNITGYGAWRSLQPK